jgi:very-short-patch-repair endonuclease
MPKPPQDVSRVSVTPRPKIATRAEEVLRWWVERQAGAVARWQLATAAVTDAQIARWVRRGRLIRWYRGVFVAGHTTLTPRGHWWAAVLACGPGAVLSHRSAAAGWALRPTSRRRVDVTTSRAGGRGHAAIDAHQSPIDPKDVTTLDGLPITTVARTALDLAEVVPQRHVERFLVAAEQQRLFDLAAFLDVLQRHPGRHGQKSLRAALAAYAPEQARSKSEMELVALDLIAAYQLPRPQVNVLVEGFEVDLYWPQQRVAVELDSRRYHPTTVAFEHDHFRRLELTARGYAATGLTWDQLIGKPEWVASRLRALLGQTPGPRTCS